MSQTYMNHYLDLKNCHTDYPTTFHRIVKHPQYHLDHQFDRTPLRAYTFTMFDSCAMWIAKLIEGEIELPSKEAMEADWQKWVARNLALKTADEEIDFQTDYVLDIVR